MGNEVSRRTLLRTGAQAVGGIIAAAVPVRGGEQVPGGAGRVSDSPQEKRDMKLETVGIMSPGDMGSAVGEVLAKHGLKVIAALGERSPRTRALAAQAGIADVGTLENLVRQADLILSVLVPDAAVAAAQRVAETMQRTGARPMYAECNAISVQSALKIAEIMKGVGAPFVDASIIGPPPRVPDKTRFYASGAHAQEFAQLSRYGLDVRVLGPEEAKATAIKVCYSTINKGTQALCTESFVSAKRLGVFDALMAELETSQKALLKYAQDGLQRMPPKAHRWVGEMNELAATYQGLGLTPRMLAGAADMYRDVGQTALGRESPEDQRQLTRTFDEFIAMLERDLPRG